MILCCGECLIDMLPRKIDGGGDGFAPFAGGAVFNTSVALGRLGSNVGFFSGISTDFLGDMLAGSLDDAGVDYALALRNTRPTTLAFVRLVDGQASYAFYDEQTAGRMIEAADLPAIPAHVSALFFGGISLVAEPAADSYAALCKREAADKLCMIDPNIRPSFITDEAAYRERIGAMLGVADIIKVSDEDLDWLAQGRAQSDYLDQLMANGVRLVCVTEGAKGVTAVTPVGQRFVPSSKAVVVDTVGAGDTFNAGLLHGLARDGLLTKSAIAGASLDDIVPAIELGAKAAAITVSRAGANPPWATELS